MATQPLPARPRRIIDDHFHFAYVIPNYDGSHPLSNVARTGGSSLCDTLVAKSLMDYVYQARTRFLILADETIETSELAPMPLVGPFPIPARKRLGMEPR